MTTKLNPATETVLRIPNLTWSYADAINIAMDMLDHHEIKLDELETVTNEIWQEMMLADNGEA